MSQKTVRIISAIIAGVIAFTLVFALVAEIAIYGKASAAQTVSSLNKQLTNLQNEKAKIQKELKAIEAKKQSTMTKKAALDQQIDVTEREIDTINSLIKALDVQIAEAAAELAAAEAEEREQTEAFLTRVRVMEEEGTPSMIGIILSADSFSDMITRTELIGSIVEGDKKLLAQIAETRSKIAEKKAVLDNSRAEQANAKRTLVDRQNSLESQYKEANTLIKSLKHPQPNTRRRLMRLKGQWLRHVHRFRSCSRLRHRQNMSAVNSVGRRRRRESHHTMAREKTRLLKKAQCIQVLI